MAHAPTTPMPCSFDPEGRIASDIVCVRCGYNLRGLQPAGPCPECGTGIERSLHGNLLAYADPEWVARLARGAAWTVRGINCMLLTLILLLFGSIAMTALSGPLGGLPSPGSFPVALVSAAGLFLFGAVSFLLGYWWLTVPDLGRPDEDEDQKTRRMGRLGLFGAPIAGMVFFLLAGVVPDPVLVVTLGYVAAGSLLVAGCIGFFGYLARLSRRIPDDKLMQRTRSVRKGLVVCIVLYVFTTLSSQILLRWMISGGPGRPSAIIAVPSCFSLLVGLSLLIYLNRALRLLMAFRKQLRLVREQARRNWNDTIVPSDVPTTADCQP